MSASDWSEWLGCVGGSLAISVLSFWGLGGLWHLSRYRFKRHEAKRWKLQPERWLSRDLGRNAFLLGSFNIVVGSLLGGSFAFYLSRGGWSAIYFDINRFGLWYLPVSAVLVFFAIDAGLYYSHRALHGRTLFRWIHRWHHRYVAPTVFTTTAMHPLEFFIFGFFLLLPAFIIPVHVAVYVCLIAYTYFIGMVDHSGIVARLPLPLHDDNRFHDDHHVYFHCNYGHHTALWDRLHQTVRRADRHYDEHTFGGRGAEIEAEARENERLFGVQ
jgi:lathosterol oxidase